MLYKADLVNRLAKKGYTKRDAGTAVDDIVTTITEILSEGEGLQLTGFGMFFSKYRDPCKKHNIATGETEEFKGRRVVRFTPGLTLKRSVEEGFIRE